GLTTGNYTVTVKDAHLCTVTSGIISITQPTAMSITISKTNVNCYGTATGTARASVAGGLAPYTFSWNNGRTTAAISGLTVGTYVVTVTDQNGCQKVMSTSITQPDSLLTVNAVSNSSHQATAYPHGGTSPYTYRWNTSPIQTTATATGLNTGQTYTVTLTDNKGCTAMASTASTRMSNPLVI